MAISIRYPSTPNLLDLEQIARSTEDGYEAGFRHRDRAEGIKAYGRSLDHLYGQQPQSMSLAALGQNVPSQQIARAPLPPVADPATARVEQAFAAQGQGPSVGEMRKYIAQAAQARGIDPGTAIRVAQSEGLGEGIWQSNLSKNGRREPSYGPFQLLVGGGDTGYPTGMGNDFMDQTGLDPSDPANWQKTIDFALDGAAKNGWGAWYGAAGAGIGNMQGINGGGQQPAQAAIEGVTGQPQQMAQGGSLLPPRDVMIDLFKSETTRPFAIELAKAAQGMRMDAADPMAQIKYQTAVAELRKATMPEAPSGYRATDNGLEAIPGGPADPNNPLNIKRVTPSNGITVSPDGTVQIGGGQKLTEGQSKDIGYYTRGLDADAALANLDTELTNWGQQNADKVPLGLGNYLKEPAFRQAKTQADLFLTAILRKDSGAAVTKQEFELYAPMFLPVPGDDAATVEGKRRARQVALLAIRSGLGTAEAVAKANEMTLGLGAPNPGSQKADRAAPNKSKTGIEWSVEP